LLLQEKLDDHPAKVLRYPVQVPEGDMHELAGFIEAAFQNEAVEMGIPWGRPARKNSPADW